MTDNHNNNTESIHHRHVANDEYDDEYEDDYEDDFTYHDTNTNSYTSSNNDNNITSTGTSSSSSRQEQRRQEQQQRRLVYILIGVIFVLYQISKFNNSTDISVQFSSLSVSKSIQTKSTIEEQRNTPLIRSKNTNGYHPKQKRGNLPPYIIPPKLSTKGNSNNNNNNSNNSKKRYQPTFLWGIQSPIQNIQQRKAVRETYLLHYEQQSKRNTTTTATATTSERHRICNFLQLVRQQQENDDKDDENYIHIEDCQIAYVFFVGANAMSDQTEFTTTTSTSNPMVLEDPLLYLPSSIRKYGIEDDVLYLNIQDNVHRGKSLTWFKYASMMIYEYNFTYFDYITKINDDTLVFLPQFLNYISKPINDDNKNSKNHDNNEKGDNDDTKQTWLPTQPNNVRVYGGVPYDKHSCNSKMKNNFAYPLCPLPLIGTIYMDGAFYWMSPDLAHFISSSSIDRKYYQIGHEDVDIGNYVHLYPSTVIVSDDGTSTTNTSHITAATTTTYTNTTLHSITIKSIDTSLILHSRNVDGNWNFVDFSKSYSDNKLWGNSYTNIYPGPFFTDERNFRKSWNQYQSYYLSNYKKDTGDIYELIDLPKGPNDPLVQINDYIYSNQDYDSSPIVIEKYKLVFFTISQVGDDIFRCFFRRMMMMISENTNNNNNHDHRDDNYNYIDKCDRKQQQQQYDDGIIKRLSDYTIDEASYIMTSSEYTRAVFIRDPKIRTLSAWLNHVRYSQSSPNEDGGSNDEDIDKDENEDEKESTLYEYEDKTNVWSMSNHCCANDISCIEKITSNFDAFVYMIQECDEPYWRPQSRQMELKYMKYINFIGRYRTLEEDVERLLGRINALDIYEKLGYYKDNDNQEQQQRQSIFSTKEIITEETYTEYYSYNIERDVERLYQSDYTLYNISSTIIQYDSTDDEKIRKGDHPTFIWGIPTVDNEKEKLRRQALRDTYLNYYKDFGSPNEKYRICNLLDVIKNRIPTFDDDHDGYDDGIEMEVCQIAYVFFIGGNPNGPTELVKPNTTYPMTIEIPNNGNDEIDDIVYLNIKENLEDGKSQTWFKYASMQMEKYNNNNNENILNDDDENDNNDKNNNKKKKRRRQIHFDYAAKVDSDALIFIPTMLEYLQRHVPASPNNVRVYGGATRDKYTCDPLVKDTHSCPLPLRGPLYMQGSLYWMSSDLAKFITSDDVDRTEMTIRHEDVDVGNFVYTHPESITTVQVDRKHMILHRLVNSDWKYFGVDQCFNDALWGHSESGFWPGPLFKDPMNIRKVWKQYLAFRLQGQRLVDHYQLFDLPAAPGDGFVHAMDYIYSREEDFDASPVVIEKYKLVFFTVAGVGDDEWRRLFRRMMGISNWKDENPSSLLQPQQQQQQQKFDGLTRLYDYNLTHASYIMTSPDYTRAMFVRDPRARLVDAYQRYVQPTRGRYVHDTCCGGSDVCGDANDFKTFAYTATFCDTSYWRPQSRRMEPRYFAHLDFVGKYNSIQGDSKKLLQRLGVWEEFGMSGWGEDGTDRIFAHVPRLDKTTLSHYYTYTDGVEDVSAPLFHSDYSLRRFGISREWANHGA